MRDLQSEATAAAIDAIGSLCDPTADDIPREGRGSYVERLESVVALIGTLHRIAIRSELPGRASYLAMIAEKVAGVANDLAAEEKGSQ